MLPLSTSIVVPRVGIGVLLPPCRWSGASQVVLWPRPWPEPAVGRQNWDRHRKGRATAAGGLLCRQRPWRCRLTEPREPSSDRTWATARTTLSLPAIKLSLGPLFAVRQIVPNCRLQPVPMPSLRRAHTCRRWEPVRDGIKQDTRPTMIHVRVTVRGPAAHLAGMDFEHFEYLRPPIG